MSNLKHRPGPLYCSEARYLEHNNVWSCRITDESGNIVDYVTNSSKETAEADGKLRAAAPDLLKALSKFVLTEAFRKMVHKSDSQFDTAYEEAKAAIKKATK